jgi:hypothetical protein
MHQPLALALYMAVMFPVGLKEAEKFLQMVSVGAYLL